MTSTSDGAPDGTPQGTPDGIPGATPFFIPDAAFRRRPSGALPPVEAALVAVERGADQRVVLLALAEHEVLLPQAGERLDDQMSLPIVEQGGRDYVPVFTSEARLSAVAPEIDTYTTVRGADLGAAWPAEDVWLVINPGTDRAATVAPDAVRALPTLFPG